MKKLLTGALLTAAVVASTGLQAQAHDGATHVLMAPFQATTTLIGGALGLPFGGLRGIIDMEKKVFEDQEGGIISDNLFMWPVNAGVAAVVAPVGFLKGIPSGVEDGAHAGWDMWDGDHHDHEDGE